MIATAYDSSNIFAKILRGEISCKKILETPYALAFEDIYPKAPIHILVIPKGAYTSFSDFSQNASPEDISGFFKSVGEVAQKVGLETSGYRILSNNGANAHQDVPHFHVHIVGGQALGPILSEIHG
jgi:diadenosine tetraphosphate (Ap4A) HIT family hydrolase